jgi:hypothetical protein
MKDVKTENIADKYADGALASNSSMKPLSSLKEMSGKFFNGFHRYGLWITIFLLIGIYIGIGVSKKYYVDKVDETIKVGGFLHKEQVYIIQKK